MATFMKTPETKMNFTSKLPQIVVMLLLAVSLQLGAQEKIAQTGFQFLSVVSDARGAALASSMVTLEARSNALFFNPATMGFNRNVVDISFSLNEWIADIKHNNISFSYTPNDGAYGVFWHQFAICGLWRNPRYCCGQ